MWCSLFQKLFPCCAVATCRVQFNWSYITSAVLVTCGVLIISACCSLVHRVTGSHEAFLDWRWICHTVERALVDRAAPAVQSVNVCFMCCDTEADGEMFLVCELLLEWRNWNTHKSTEEIRINGSIDIQGIDFVFDCWESIMRIFYCKNGWFMYQQNIGCISVFECVIILKITLKCFRIEPWIRSILSLWNV